MSSITWEKIIKLFEAENDLVKHIATLDTAAIVVMASLLDRFSAAPSSKFLVQIAFASFGVSIIGVVIHQFNLLTMHYNLLSPFPRWVDTPQDSDGSIRKLIKPFMRGYWSSLLFALAGFLTGLLALIFFAIENL